MKKKFLIGLFISFSIYAKDISIDNLLDILSQTTYQNSIYNAKTSQTKKAQKIYKLSDFNGVSVEAGTEYDTDEKRYKYEGTAKFGPFYATGEKYESDEDRIKIGVEKNLKDLLYSNDKSSLKKLNFEKEIDRIELKQGIETQKLDLIALYQDYKDNQFELHFRQNSLKTLFSEKKSLETSYRLGNISKLDLETSLTSYNNMKIEIDKVSYLLEQITKRFYYEFGFDINGINLLDFPTYTNPDLKKNISYIGEKNLKILALKKQVTNESIKYLKYDNNIPDIYLGAERDLKDEDNRIFIKVSKDLFQEDINLVTEESNYEQQEIMYNQTKNETLATRYEIESNYNTRIKDYQIHKNKAQLEKSEYEIKRKEYKLGRTSYNDMIDSFDDYIEAELSKEKAKNALSGYVYEIIVRSEM